MSAREATWTATRTLAGLCAAYVTVHAVLTWIVTDLRFDPVTTIIYCGFPLLSFPAFVLVHRVRVELAVQCVLALGYWIAYSMLSWRACSANGYCSTVGDTVLNTLGTKPVEAALGVVILSLIALIVDRKRRPVEANQTRGAETARQ